MPIGEPKMPMMNTPEKREKTFLERHRETIELMRNGVVAVTAGVASRFLMTYLEQQFNIQIPYETAIAGTVAALVLLLLNKLDDLQRENENHEN